MNIEEAKNARSDISLEGKIEEKGEARTVNTKYGETQVCDSYLVDDSGRIKLTLWGEDIGKVKNGDTVSVQGAYTTTFRNEVQLNVPSGKNGKLEVISSDGDCDEEEEMTEDELERYEREERIKAREREKFVNRSHITVDNYRTMQGL